MSSASSDETNRNNFTPRIYRLLISSILNKGYQFKLFNEEVDKDEPYVLLRHDIDLSPLYALAIAEVESFHDVKASYFFQLSSPLYNIFSSEVKNTIERIHESGHLVGLHFDPCSYGTDLVSALKQEIEVFTSNSKSELFSAIETMLRVFENLKLALSCKKLSSSA